MLDAVDALARLSAGGPLLAARTTEVLTHRLNTARRTGDQQTLLGAGQHLAAAPDAAAALLALGLVRALGPRTGWAQPWRELLRTLRRHPDADVRASALEVTTAQE